MEIFLACYRKKLFLNYVCCDNILVSIWYFFFPNFLTFAFLIKKNAFNQWFSTFVVLNNKTTYRPFEHDVPLTCDLLLNVQSKNRLSHYRMLAAEIKYFIILLKISDSCLFFSLLFFFLLEIILVLLGTINHNTDKL